MALSSTSKQSPMPMKEMPSNYHSYPTPVVRYEDVVASPKLFMDTLEKLHATMGTKFMTPIVGGRDLDLHRLFVAVTSRGGFSKILKERRWKEITAVFEFPSTATNASFVLRKYYASLLQHYEQIYFFKAKGWTPIPADVLQSSTAAPIPARQLPEVVVPVSAEMHAQKINTTMAGATTPSPSSCSPVTGIIDGKFESGYLVTVTIGSEKLKGVLYQSPPILAHEVSQQQSAPHHQSVTANNRENAAASSGVLRRRRRKKSEMRKRDPAHPKPNRSGYNFFFAEQHARLKPLHPGKDRDISRMIGELWTGMNEAEKSVYQDKAMKDKERYRVEMEDYKERLRTGQIISNAIPIQQRPLDLDVNMVGADDKMENESLGTPRTPENEISSGKSHKSDLEDDKTTDKDLDMEIYVDEAEKVGDKSEENLGDYDPMEIEKDLVSSKAKELVGREDH